MKVDNINKFFRVLLLNAKANSATILTVIGVTGVITTTVMAVKATPKAIILLEEAEKEKGEPLDIKETVAVTWRLYAPSVVVGAGTIGCIVGANSISTRRNAALASMYGIAETTLKEYQNKIVETIGEKKAKDIEEKIAQDRLDNNPLSSSQVIVTGGGETLCFDTLSGRYFKSSIEKIRKVENDMNQRLISEMWLSLNELYDKLGMSGISLGDEVGWNVDGFLDFHFTAKIADDGQPCIVVDHWRLPSGDYMA